jgi:hypothetical protein
MTDCTEPHMLARSQRRDGEGQKGMLKEAQS